MDLTHFIDAGYTIQERTPATAKSELQIQNFDSWDDLAERLYQIDHNQISVYDPSKVYRILHTELKLPYYVIVQPNGDVQDNQRFYDTHSLINYIETMSNPT